MSDLPFTLLLIEDDDHDAHLFATILNEVTPDTELVRVSDAASALEQLQAWQPRLPRLLIVLDLQLPDQHGHEVLDYLKSHANLRQVPVVIFSTSDDPDDVNRSYQLQANGYLTKPVDFATSQELIRTLVQYWRTAVQLPVGT